MYEWKDEYCIGNDVIDEQHKTLFMICNRIERIFDDRDDTKDRRAAMEGIKYLKEYTLRHFSDEERVQQEVRYRDRESHKQIHDNFREEILSYEAKLEQEQYSRECVLALLDTVKDWLIHHIMGMDQKIMVWTEDDAES